MHLELTILLYRRGQMGNLKPSYPHKTKENIFVDSSCLLSFRYIVLPFLYSNNRNPYLKNSIAQNRLVLSTSINNQEIPPSTCSQASSNLIITYWDCLPRWFSYVKLAITATSMPTTLRSLCYHFNPVCLYSFHPYTLYAMTNLPAMRNIDLKDKSTHPQHS